MGSKFFQQINFAIARGKCWKNLKCIDSSQLMEILKQPNLHLKKDKWGEFFFSRIIFNSKGNALLYSLHTNLIQTLLNTKIALLLIDVLFCFWSKYCIRYFLGSYNSFRMFGQFQHKNNELFALAFESSLRN